MSFVLKRYSGFTYVFRPTTLQQKGEESGPDETLAWIQRTLDSAAVECDGWSPSQQHDQEEEEEGSHAIVSSVLDLLIEVDISLEEDSDKTQGVADFCSDFWSPLFLACVVKHEKFVQSFLSFLTRMSQHVDASDGCRLFDPLEEIKKEAKAKSEDRQQCQLRVFAKGTSGHEKEEELLESSCHLVFSVVKVLVRCIATTAAADDVQWFTEQVQRFRDKERQCAFLPITLEEAAEACKVQPTNTYEEEEHYVDFARARSCLRDRLGVHVVLRGTSPSSTAASPVHTCLSELAANKPELVAFAATMFPEGTNCSSILAAFPPPSAEESEAAAVKTPDQLQCDELLGVSVLQLALVHSLVLRPNKNKSDDEVVQGLHAIVASNVNTSVVLLYVAAWRCGNRSAVGKPWDETDDATGDDDEKLFASLFFAETHEPTATAAAAPETRSLSGPLEAFFINHPVPTDAREELCTLVEVNPSAPGNLVPRQAPTRIEALLLLLLGTSPGKKVKRGDDDGDEDGDDVAVTEDGTLLKPDATHDKAKKKPLERVKCCTHFWGSLVRAIHNDVAGSIKSGLCGFDEQEAQYLLHALNDVVEDPAAVAAQTSKKLEAMSLSEQFNLCQTEFGKIAGKYSNDIKLNFYGLFKQATVGDVNTKRPWAMDFAGRAKWDAWDSRKPMSKTEAMEAYVHMYKELTQ